MCGFYWATLCVYVTTSVLVHVNYETFILTNVMEAVKAIFHVNQYKVLNSVDLRGTYPPSGIR